MEGLATAEVMGATEVAAVLPTRSSGEAAVVATVEVAIPVAEVTPQPVATSKKAATSQVEEPTMAVEVMFLEEVIMEVEEHTEVLCLLLPL